MTNNENINELETLRSQLNILKKKLDDQTIVNDQLLRNAMSNKMSWIMKYIWFFYILAQAADVSGFLSAGFFGGNYAFAV